MESGESVGNEAASSKAGNASTSAGGAPSKAGASEPASKAQTAPPANEQKRGVWEWVWRGWAMRSAKRARSALPVRAVESARQGRLAAELGERVLDPTEALGQGSVDALACELYRQATYWMLRSCLERAVSADGETPAHAGSSLKALWAEIDERGLLAELDHEVPNLSEVRAQLTQTEFAGFADLEKSEQAKLARAARKLSEALIQRLDVSSAISRYWRQRLGRSTLLLGALAVLAVGALNARDAYRMKSDLAQGKAWSISSTNRMGCASPAQVCDSAKDFFFHTRNQAQPWFMLDLGAPQTFSSVYVANRKDCCYHRAIPLVVEVSNDGKTWKEVARRTEVFTSAWRADFPAVEARFVRLRVERWSILHLSAVKVLP